MCESPLNSLVLRAIHEINEFLTLAVALQATVPAPRVSSMDIPGLKGRNVRG
jgi:hypothetical protein